MNAIAVGPWGMLPLSVLDSVGIPIAGALDALLIFLSVKDPSHAYLAATLSVIGSTGGNIFLFLTARRGGKKFLERSAQPGRSQRFRQWFERYGLATVFVPALVPIPMPMKLFVISAGALHTRIGPFVAVIVIVCHDCHFAVVTSAPGPAGSASGELLSNVVDRSMVITRRPSGLRAQS